LIFVWICVLDSTAGAYKPDPIVSWGIGLPSPQSTPHFSHFSQARATWGIISILRGMEGLVKLTIIGLHPATATLGRGPVFFATL